MIQSSSAGHAKAYFSEALAKADYYLNDQELAGKFEGKLAERLGLTGEGKSGLATKEDFHALCENINPKTGKQLTPRVKEERTVGYDINFHCPKSVSIIHALSKDDHLLKAFEQSVQETMRDIEADAMTRIRKDKQYEDRQTGNLAWASFTHQTARPTEDTAPDPHLHSHCFVFNATYDAEESKIKAGQFRDIKRDMPYYQARFHKRLSDSLVELGYQVRRTDKSFEVEGVPQPVIELFSKRTNEIGEIAKAKGITDAKELDNLGACTRARKQKGLSMSELKADWKRQIAEVDVSASEGGKVVRFANEPTKSDIEPDKQLTADQCVDYALTHCFERASVVQDRRILASAYRHSLGHKTIKLDSVTKSMAGNETLFQVQDGSRMMCTTKEVLKEERRMVELAREGQGKMRPLYKEAPKLTLEGQQAEAVSHVLTTPHRVSIIRGAAGTGKTTLMKEAVKHIEAAGKQVMVVAPTAQASRGVLKEEGFAGADTVAKLLTDKPMQDNLLNQILWVDEAGLLGTKDMSALLKLTKEKNARLILGGDTRQHSSVIRGDALRILNTVAGIKTAEVSKIYRQKNEQYKSAVADLSDGNVAAAFETLDGMGAVKEIDPLKPNAQLVDDYLQAVKAGKSCLVVSPTHAQGENTTDDIRKRLKQEGLLGKKELAAVQYKALNLTEADKADLRSYKPGQSIQFNQHAPGIKRGSMWQVDEVGTHGVRIKDDAGNFALLPMDKADRFDLFDKRQIGLSKGDAVRITRNGMDANEKRLNSGQSLEVVRVTKAGEILLRNAQSKATYKLDKGFGHIAHAYCVTSHASQGKTVDEVFIAQPAATFDATNSKQFYVSVSRGRERCRIYTDDKAQLLAHAKRLGDRQSAIELMQMDEQNKAETNDGKTVQDYAIERNRKDAQIPKPMQTNRTDKQREASIAPDKQSPVSPSPKQPDRAYEPEL